MKISLGSCSLKPWFAVFIGVAPLGVYVLSEWLLRTVGLDFGTAPKELLAYDANRAAAPRLAAFGAFLLMTGASAAAFLYFLFTLRLLEKWSLVIVGGVYAATLILLSLTVLPQRGPQEAAFSQSGLVCTVFYYEGQKEFTAIEAKGKKTGRVQVPEKLGTDPCQTGKRHQLVSLMKWNQRVVLLGLVSLIFGSICCLAGPAATAPLGGELEHYEDQSERLNTYLYLSAALLVTGLFFVATLLKWPSHALADAVGYTAHADALTTYYGVTYTMLLASFYMPIAVMLAERVRRLKPAAGGGGKLPHAFKGPLQLLKIAVAMFSTTAAGLASNLVGFGG